MVILHFRPHGTFVVFIRLEKIDMTPIFPMILACQNLLGIGKLICSGGIWIASLMMDLAL